MRRFRCTECEWAGLLQESPDALFETSRHARARSGWIIGGTLILVPAIALLILWKGGSALDDPIPADIPAAGVPLDPTDPRVLAGGQHELRRGCTWVGPEASPYTGSFGAALASAGIPPDVIAKLELMRERGLASDRVVVSDDGVQSTDRRRQFGHTATAMALGDVVCFTTRIDVLSDANITADLYEVVDSMDRRYAVMVVDPGGNVALLQEQVER